MQNKPIINIQDIRKEEHKKLVQNMQQLFLNNSTLSNGGYYGSRRAFTDDESNLSKSMSGLNNNEKCAFLMENLCKKSIVFLWNTLTESFKSSFLKANEDLLISLIKKERVSIGSKEPYLGFSLFSCELFSSVNAMFKYVMLECNSMVSSYNNNIKRNLEANDSCLNPAKLFLSCVKEFGVAFVSESVKTDEEIEVIYAFSESLISIDEEAYKILQTAKQRLGKVIFENRDYYLKNNIWYGWRAPRSFCLYFDYALENEYDFWYNDYNRLDNASKGYNSSEYYYGMKLRLLARKDKDAFLKLFPNGVKKAKLKAEKRKQAYKAFIECGEIDKKRVRRMRSDASESVSLECLKYIMSKRNSFTEQEYDSYIVLFSDTKYSVVMNHLQNNLGSKHLLGLLGNPLSNKKLIFKRINEMRDEDE